MKLVGLMHGRLAGFSEGIRWQTSSKSCKFRNVNATFETLVEQVRTRSTAEKEELKFLIERDLIEQRRREIRANHRRSQKEMKRDGLKFSSDIGELKKALAA